MDWNFQLYFLFLKSCLPEEIFRCAAPFQIFAELVYYKYCAALLLCFCYIDLQPTEILVEAQSQ